MVFSLTSFLQLDINLKELDRTNHHNSFEPLKLHIFYSVMSNSSKVLPTEPKALRVGCIGGGQLGRMMALEAPRLNIQMSFLDPAGDDCPAAAAAGRQSITLKGSLNDESKLRELAANCDVVTCEIEHIGTEVLQKLESEGINVQPSGHVVKIIQDKYVQKVRPSKTATSGYIENYFLTFQCLESRNILQNTVFHFLHMLIFQTSSLSMLQQISLACHLC